MGNKLGNTPAFRLHVIFLINVDTHIRRRDKTVRHETHLLKTIYSSDKQTRGVTNIIECFHMALQYLTENKELHNVTSHFRSMYEQIGVQFTRSSSIPVLVNSVA